MGTGGLLVRRCFPGIRGVSHVVLTVSLTSRQSVAVYAIVIVFQFVNEVNPFIGLLYEAAARYEAGQVLSTESQQLLNAQVASLLNVQSSYYS